MMTRPMPSLLVLRVGGAGLVLSGSPTQFVVLRQALRCERSSAASDSSALSADGRFVAFVSRARLSPTETRGIENIYVFDRVSRTIDPRNGDVDGPRPWTRGSARCSARRPVSGLLSTRRTCRASDTKCSSDIFRAIRSIGTIAPNRLEPVAEMRTEPAISPAISNDGNTVVFASRASNLAERRRAARCQEMYVVRSSTGSRAGTRQMNWTTVQQR